MFAEIQPADVYHRVLAIEATMAAMMYMMGVVCLLIVAQLVAKFLIFRPMVAACERMVTVAERHGLIDDDHRQRVAARIDGVKDEVAKVPERTAERVKDALPKPPPPGFPMPAVLALLAAAAGVSTAAVLSTPEAPAVTHAESAAVKYESHPADARLEAAMAEMRAGNHAVALPLFLQARDMGADPVRSIGRAAECRVYLGDYRDAMLLCDELNARVPECGYAHHVRGLAYDAQNRQTDARREYRAAAAYGLRAARLKLAGRS